MELQKRSRKGGRPRLLDEERRAFSVRPGFTEHEFSLLEARAESTGLDPAEFVRRLALNKEFYSVPQINREAIIELIKIGNNLNQVAKVANTTQNKLAIEALGQIKASIDNITLSLTSH